MTSKPRNNTSKTHTGLPENFTDPYVTPVGMVPLKDETLSLGEVDRKFENIFAKNLNISGQARLPADTGIAGFSLTDPTFNTVTVNNVSNLNGPVSVDATLDVTGATTIDDVLHVTGAVDIDGFFTLNDTFLAQNGVVED